MGDVFLMPNIGYQESFPQVTHKLPTGYPRVTKGLSYACPQMVLEEAQGQAQAVRGDPVADAYTYLDFGNAAKKYGRTGGFAHVKTLLDRLREQAGGTENTLTIDGGDLWQGSGTALWTRGVDMVEASNILGLDVMVGHWEFTYRENEVLSNVALFKGDFIGQNVRVKEDALFGDEYSTMVKYSSPNSESCFTRTF